MKTLDPARVAAYQSAYARIRHASAQAAAEAFMLAEEWKSFEPVPLWPTPAGLAVPA